MPLPDWISNDPQYSTGAELADINKDGWLDLIVSDGNDMQPGKVKVYYNDGNGNLPKTADWQSSDTCYNGHLDVADVNGDGWLDVAVSYLGTGYTFGPVARVYLNNNGVLSSLPDWNASLIGNAFGLDFGDVNNDGRPDLAVATGWGYEPQHYYHNLVYMNVGGTLESTPSWQSFDTNTYMGAYWVDADSDGWLDLAFIGIDVETQIYHNLGGMLETTASWHTTDSMNQFGIMLTSGDVDLDGKDDLFATDNTQLGGSGLFKQYRGLSQGFYESTYSWSYYEGYGSAVALADVNYDNNLDLATGGWWDYTRIFLNDGVGLPTTSSWNSGGTSVVEKIVFGNVGPTFDEHTFNEVFTPDTDCRLFYLSHKNIQKINSVKVDNIFLDFSEYTYSREHAWVTINTIPSSYVEISYNFSKSLDMVVSNWDPGIGNYLYYNKINVTLIPDLESEGTLSWSNIKPGAKLKDSFKILNIGDSLSGLNWQIVSFPDWGTWYFEPDSGNGLTPEDGAVTVYVNLIAPDKPGTLFNGSVIIVNMNNSSDFEIVPVTLTTPVNYKKIILQNNQNLLLFLQQIQKLIKDKKYIIKYT
ncbi:MAG: VCBS repeat-containing protein [Candidatus Thermoplasmatota archaeon]|nr:VCBS repeat-containing protein [Candidatus Thermoplasmatota archaeon]